MIIIAPCSVKRDKRSPMKFSRFHFSSMVLLATHFAVAQEHQHQHPPAVGHEHHQAGEQSPNSSADFLLSESSGTALQPRAWPMPMLMNGLGQWKFMWMGQ